MIFFLIIYGFINHLIKMMDLYIISALEWIFMPIIKQNLNNSTFDGWINGLFPCIGHEKCRVHHQAISTLLGCCEPKKKNN